MSTVWEDPRVVEGMSRLRSGRAAELEAGAELIGWKLAFGTRDAQATLGIDGPVVGHLTDATVLDPGASCPVGEWERPVLEAELAIYLTADLSAGAGATDAAAAIGAIGPAIELADADTPPERLTEVIAGDIFHRAVMLPDEERRRAGPDSKGLSVVVSRDGEECARNDDPLATVGELPRLVLNAAAYLEAFGDSLRAGQVLISGSTVPLVPLEPGQRLSYRLEPIGSLELGVGD
jgi:2-keto-4-pentenoate hydratase